MTQDKSAAFPSLVLLEFIINVKCKMRYCMALYLKGHQISPVELLLISTKFELVTFICGISNTLLAQGQQFLVLKLKLIENVSQEG